MLKRILDIPLIIVAKFLGFLVLILLAIFLVDTLAKAKNSKSVENNIPSSISNKSEEYLGGEIYSSGFEYLIPAGWRVTIKKDLSLENRNRINIDFVPPGWERPDDIMQPDWYGWGTLSVDVHPPVNSVEEYLQEQYPDYESLIYKEETIGNKTGYKITAGPDADYREREFRGRRVVLGRKYVYELHFSEGYHADEAIPINEQTLQFLKFE